MDRRSMLKVLPLAALAGVSVKVGETKAQAFEMKPDKHYVFYIPDIQEEDARQAASVLRSRDINATVVSGAAGLQIYEVEQSFAGGK